MPRELISLTAPKIAHIVNLAAAVAASVGGSMDPLVWEIVETLTPFKAAESEAWEKNPDRYAPENNRAHAQTDLIRLEIAAAIQAGCKPKAPTRPDFNGNALTAWQMAQATQAPHHAILAARLLICEAQPAQVQYLAQIIADTKGKADDYAQTARTLTEYFRLRAAQRATLNQIAAVIDGRGPMSTDRVDLWLANWLTEERHTHRPADLDSQQERAAIHRGAADVLLSRDALTARKVVQLIDEGAPEIAKTDFIENMRRTVQNEREGIANALQVRHAEPQDLALTLLFSKGYEGAALKCDKYTPTRSSETWKAYRVERCREHAERYANQDKCAGRFQAAYQSVVEIMDAVDAGKKAPTLTALADKYTPPSADNSGPYVPGQNKKLDHATDRDKKEIKETIKSILASFGARLEKGALIWFPAE